MSHTYTLEANADIASPILISMPHVGTEFPQDIQHHFIPDKIAKPRDTDWFVDQLYPFASDLGIQVIKPRFSRYLIDLNRNTDGKKLYDDGRQETSLVSKLDFAGDPLYLQGHEPDEQEVQRRIKTYYTPYHEAIRTELAKIHDKWGFAILFEAHSIRRSVPLLSDKPFPDLIVGDQHEKTCRPEYSKSILSSLRSSSYGCEHNNPFMGGYLTRLWGRPEQGYHSIQLEMVQDLYMDENKLAFDNDKAKPIIRLLEKTFRDLLVTIDLTAQN